MKEKDFQSLFTKWIRDTEFRSSAAWELKISKRSAMPFSAVQEHQINKLMQAKHDCVYIKHPDSAMGFKPFDASQVCFGLAYVVILFYEPRKPKKMHWIDIDRFIEEKKTSPRKSLTKERSEIISEYIFDLSERTIGFK
jgi:sulfur transfer protein SufE